MGILNIGRGMILFKFVYHKTMFTPFYFLEQLGSKRGCNWIEAFAFGFQNHRSNRVTIIKHIFFQQLIKQFFPLGIPRHVFNVHRHAHGVGDQISMAP